MTQNSRPPSRPSIHRQTVAPGRSISSSSMSRTTIAPSPSMLRTSLVPGGSPSNLGMNRQSIAPPEGRDQFNDDDLGQVECIQKLMFTFGDTCVSAGALAVE